jgi:hypothetical protein
MAFSEFLNQNMYFIKQYFYDHVIFFTVYVWCDTYWWMVVNVLRSIEYVNKIWENYVITWIGVLLEKLLVTQMVKKFFLFFCT